MARRLAVGAGILAWMLITAALYYTRHKPFDPAQAAVLGLVVLRCGAAASLLLVSGGLGARFLSGLQVPALAGMAVQLALGIAILAPLLLAAGSLVGVSPLIGWLALVFLAILLRKSILDWLYGWRDLPGLLQGHSALVRLSVFLTAAILFATGLVALAPPVKFDALVYHLTLPRAYLQAGRIFHPPGGWFWGMPQSGEMFYTWATALVDERAAAVLGWSWGVAALAGIFGYTAARFGRRPAWAAIAALLSGYTLAYGLGIAYVDWLAILFGLAVLVALENWWRSGRQKDLLLVGIFCGAAIGVKYSAGVIIFGALFTLVYKSRRSLSSTNTRRQLLTDGLILCLVTGLTVLPWLLKNILATGNPMAPFLFAADEFSRFRSDFYRLPVWGGWQDVVLLPLQASLLGMEGTPGYSATIGPLILSLAALGCLPWKNVRAQALPVLQIARLTAGCGLIAWAVFSRLAGLLVQTRLYFVIFPALALLAAAGYKSISRLGWPGVRLGRVAASLILFIYGLTTFSVVMQTLEQGTPQVVLGLTSEQSYREQSLGWYARAMPAMQNLPAGSRVMLLWEPRSFDCLPRCNPDETIDRWMMARLAWKDPAAIQAHWVADGYTHILYYRLGAEFVRGDDNRYQIEDWQAQDAFLQRMAKVSDFGDGYTLYLLQP